MEHDQLKQQLLRLEETLLQPHIRKAPEELSRLLADDFKEFGGSGRMFDKQQVIGSLANETTERMEIAAFELKLLAPDIALVTYRLTKPAISKQSLRSSIWQRNEDTWQMVFHQGTPAAATE